MRFPKITSTPYDQGITWRFTSLYVWYIWRWRPVGGDWVRWEFHRKRTA